MSDKPYIKVPTWNAGKWEYTIFQTKNEFRSFVKGLFKEPGKYNFDSTAFEFNSHAITFNKKGLYCEAPEGSQDYYKFWDTEREKCRRGVIYKNGKGDVWYLPRFYYHWVNFLRIYRKAPPKGFHFPDVRDVQYHMALYEFLAELHNKNSVVLKKRQIASSYFHIAKIYNRYIFEDGFVAKILASDKKYINATATWKFLEEYHNFTNEHTAWACSNMPDRVFEWKQLVETKTPDGRKVTVGTKATIAGITLDKDPTSGVGGAVDEVFYEEGGIAPTADKTYDFMRAAMEEGGIVTGHFVIAGSVGELDKCQPLRDFIYDPKGNDFYPTHSDLLDENRTEGTIGLFIPEQWGMPGTQPGDEDEDDDLPVLPNCIDEYGNSLVEKALASLNARYAYAKKVKSAVKYQYLVSQKPRNLAEALATRKISPFPIKHTSTQIKRIEDDKYFLKYVTLDRDDSDKVIMIPSEKLPMEYPTNKKLEDKTGVVVIHEDPVKDSNGEIKWLTYLASIDPVETGDSKNSESLASVYIYKVPIEVDNKVTNTIHIEGGKLVCEWVGRFDDPIKTNEQISRVLELYNAYGICEKNKPGFISYMQMKRRQKYLAKATDMIFDKEHENTDDTYKAYGYTMTPGLWKKLLQYGIDSISEEIAIKKKEDGTIDKISYGVERIPFTWLLKEMQDYQDKGNYDRVIAYCALMAFVARQQAVMGVRKKIERSATPIEEGKKYEEMTNLLNNRQPFRNIGRNNNMQSQYSIPRKAFKNLR